jgi:hypothetical protein
MALIARGRVSCKKGFCVSMGFEWMIYRKWNASGKPNMTITLQAV